MLALGALSAVALMRSEPKEDQGQTPQQVHKQLEESGHFEECSASKSSAVGRAIARRRLCQAADRRVVHSVQEVPSTHLQVQVAPGPRGMSPARAHDRQTTRKQDLNHPVQDAQRRAALAAPAATATPPASPGTSSAPIARRYSTCPINACSGFPFSATQGPGVQVTSKLSQPSFSPASSRSAAKVTPAS